MRKTGCHWNLDLKIGAFLSAASDGRRPGDTAGTSGGLFTCNKTGLSSALELVAGGEESSQFTSKLLGIGEKNPDLPTQTS